MSRIINGNEVLDAIVPKKTNKGKLKGVETGIAIITPEVAEKLLKDHNPNNRNIKQANVDSLVSEMVNNRWVMNGEGVIIDYNGNLVDGQHRLTACVFSKRSMTTQITWGVAPSVITTIDTGSKRIAKDCFDINGISNASVIASSIKLIHQFSDGAYGDKGSSSRVLSNQQTLDFYWENSEKLQNSAVVANSVYKKCNQIITSSIIASLHYMFAEKDVNKANEFFNKFGTGVGLDENSPIMALRNKLTRAALDKQIRMTQKEKVENVIHAWNKFRKNQTCKTLKVPQDTKIVIE
jgi:hypothetical protein